MPRIIEGFMPKRTGMLFKPLMDASWVYCNIFINMIEAKEPHSGDNARDVLIKPLQTHRTRGQLRLSYRDFKNTDLAHEQKVALLLASSRPISSLL